MGLHAFCRCCCAAQEIETDPEAQDHQSAYKAGVFEGMIVITNEWGGAAWRIVIFATPEVEPR